MNLFTKIFQPRLGHVIHRLGQIAGLTHPNLTYENTMSNFTNVEEIEIIEGAARVILAQKTALADAVQKLTPLADENLNLRSIIRGLEAEDAASDEALGRLRDLLPKAPAENPPVVGEDPETPPPAGTETPAGVDPVDPPVDPAPEAPAGGPPAEPPVTE